MRALRALIVFALCLLPLAVSPHAQSPTGLVSSYRDDVTRLMRAATGNDFAWRRLAEMTDVYGSRLSGSDNLTRAIAWAADRMKGDGLENVHTEPVMVPRWIRGQESAEIIDPPLHDVA